MGIEAVAGLVISQDIFGTNKFPDAHFCTCAEVTHAVTGIADNFDDHLAVAFRVVEIKDGTYPLVGRESVRMILQPLSDGNVSARWHAVDRGGADRSLDEADLLGEGADVHRRECSPLVLGRIPGQEEMQEAPPAFLLLKDPGAGWQIWRRFLQVIGDGDSPGAEEYRQESYTMVYPMLSAEMNWRFRVYSEPGGGARVEIDSGRHR